MKEFTILNYDTSYKYASYSEARDIPANEFKVCKHNTCFSSLFHNCSGKKKVIIKIFSGTNYVKNTHSNNACLFSKSEIEEHISVAKELFDFEYTVSRKKRLEHGRTGYEVSIDVPDESGLHVKYLVTWIRYLYEYPYNVSLLDVYQLKKLPKFKDMTVENLLLVVLNCHIIGDGWKRGIHSIPAPRKGFFFTTEELKQQKLREMIEIFSGQNVF